MSSIVGLTNLMAPSTISNRTTIFVALMNEGTDVWRPVAAERLSEHRFLIVEACETDDEVWQFPPGSVVRCELREFSGGKSGLTAVELAAPPG